MKSRAQVLPQHVEEQQINEARQPIGGGELRGGTNVFGGKRGVKGQI